MTGRTARDPHHALSRLRGRRHRRLRDARRRCRTAPPPSRGDVAVGGVPRRASAARASHPDRPRRLALGRRRGRDGEAVRVRDEGRPARRPLRRPGRGQGLGDRAEGASVAAGDELDVRLEEVHLRHPEDAIARLDGYVIAVGGAASRVGETVSVRIERATRTVASMQASPVSRRPRRRSRRGSGRGGRGRGARVAEETHATAARGRSQQKPAPATKAAEEPAAEAEPESEAEEAVATAASGAETPPKKKTRRGTRGGREGRSPPPWSPRRLRPRACRRRQPPR